MSVFNRLDRLTSRAVDKAMSIRFEVQPAKITPNGRPGPDPDREAWDGRGVLDENAGYSPVEVGKRDRSGNDLQSLAAGNTIELSVDKSWYTQASQTKQGDRIQTDDLRRFEVTSVRPDGLSRVMFALVELK